jgi:hypothetical protein
MGARPSTASFESDSQSRVHSNPPEVFSGITISGTDTERGLFRLPSNLMKDLCKHDGRFSSTSQPLIFQIDAGSAEKLGILSKKH